MENLDIIYIKKFLSEQQSNMLFVKVFQDNFVDIDSFKDAKGNAMPRLIKWYGDKAYAYANIYHKAIKLPYYLEEIKDKINQLLKENNIHSKMNSVLINYYRNGLDKINYHSDDQTQIGSEPVIVSLSLGETRNFIFRNKKTKEKIEYILESGDLLIMKGKTQDFWQHAVLPENNKKERINLTFRNTIYDPKE